MTQGDRSGGTVRLRATVDGKRKDVYHAVCETCHKRGPASERQRGAKTAAIMAGWQCERVRVARSIMESYVWRVRCPEHKLAAAP